jgi:hypothetical protein
MTRSALRRTLRRIYALLGIILAVSFFSKIAEHITVLNGTGIEKLLKDVYEFLRDMALLIATGGVAYITNVFQKRHAFIDSLKSEWQDIIEAKSALLTFMHNETPTHTDYISAFTRLSETIDNMRIVYRNVGETNTNVGLFPYAPLHDMRRALQTLDPKKSSPTPEQRKLARDAMLQSFYALRDGFLDELELDEPDTPILMSGARRLRIAGSTKSARRSQEMQIETQKRSLPDDDEIAAFLRKLYADETNKNVNNGSSLTQASTALNNGSNHPPTL